MAAAKKDETPMLNIHQRILQVMAEVTYVQKDKKQGMNYSIVSHDVVTAKVRPHLVDAGITYYPVSIARSQQGNRTEMDMIVRFTNADDPTDFIDVCSSGYGVDSQDKGPGKAQSYAVKYALLKVLGLETGDDPDKDQEKEAEHKPEYVTNVEAFVDRIAMCTTEAQLGEAFETYAKDIDAASKTHGSMVATAKSRYAQKLKALRDAAAKEGTE